MARIVCRGCGYDGEGAVEGAPTCPRCGSTDCRAAIAVMDLTEDVIDLIARSVPSPRKRRRR